MRRGVVGAAGINSRALRHPSVSFWAIVWCSRPDTTPRSPPFLPRSPPHEGTISRIIASPPPLPERHRRRSFRRKRSSLPFFANRNGNENETTTKTTTEKKKKKLTEIGIEELARIALRLAARAYLIQ